MTDFVFGILVGAALGVVVLGIMVYLGAKRLERRILQELAELEQQELPTQTDMVATVEVVENRYFCYEKYTSQFICHGATLSELVDHFRQRYPQQALTLESEDSTIMAQLAQQHNQAQSASV